MGAPLKDFRVPVSEAVHTWLDAEATAFNVSMQDVARDILKDWARKKAHAYKVATKRLKANGLQPELFGPDEEDDGLTRSSSKERDR